MVSGKGEEQEPGNQDRKILSSFYTLRVAQYLSSLARDTSSLLENIVRKSTQAAICGQIEFKTELIRKINVITEINFREMKLERKSE
jgi:hypothetical protein